VKIYAEEKRGSHSATRDPECVRDYGEEEQHYDCRNDSGRNQLSHRIGAESPHGVDLLRNHHGPEFAGHPGGVTAGYHQAGNHGPEFADHSERHQLSDQRKRAESLQGATAILGQRASGEEAAEYDDGQRAHPDEVSLLCRVPEIARTGKRIAYGTSSDDSVFLYCQDLLLSPITRGDELNVHEKEYSRDAMVRFRQVDAEDPAGLPGRDLH
jgi:hypothetical protein